MKRIRITTATLLTSLLLTVSSGIAAPRLNTGGAFNTALPAAYMDDPRRSEWQMPAVVLERLQIKPGAIVADIGAGTGFFTLLLAQQVGKSGTVYAVDIDPAMIQTINHRREVAGLSNIKPLLIRDSELPVPQSSLDLLFLCDTYLFIENRISYLTRARSRLKDSGRLAIISFNAAAEIAGAPPPHMMVAKAVTIAEAEKAGFALEADYTFLPFQDFLLFRKR